MIEGCRLSDLDRSAATVSPRELVELQWDLGGLAYEMAIRDHFRLDVLTRQAAKLQQVDAELGEVERMLKLDQAGAAGACGDCGALYAQGSVFCWQCGKDLMPQSTPDGGGPVTTASASAAPPNGSAAIRATAVLRWASLPSPTAAGRRRWRDRARLRTLRRRRDRPRRGRHAGHRRPADHRNAELSAGPTAERGREKATPAIAAAARIERRLRRRRRIVLGLRAGRGAPKKKRSNRRRERRAAEEEPTAPSAAPEGRRGAPKPEEQELAGTVVHVNPAAGSYTVAETGGVMSAVHAGKLPAAGTRSKCRSGSSPTAPSAEAGARHQTGTKKRTTLAGIVTYVDADPAAPAYAVSNRGSSVLVHVQPEAAAPCRRCRPSAPTPP